jgi:DNA-directed RNA polymerase subunit RPC12/RpoP
MNMTSDNPIRLNCPRCSAPIKYDMAGRVYRCPSCGTETPPAEEYKRIEGWRSLKKEQIKSEYKSAGKAVYKCSGCGARIVIPEGEAVGQCSFCGSGLARMEFSEKDSFPELIVPFEISKEQAEEALQSWAKAKGTGAEKAAVDKYIGSLKGYYLPYQFVRGPIECRVFRDTSSRQYQCGGYVDEIAVNTSGQLVNQVLDAVEPFDWDKVREFNFGYISGNRVKMQDINNNAVQARVNQEVTDDYLPVVEKTLQTKGLGIYAENSDLEQLPVLLPMYIISNKSFMAAVNGQTGAVAVTLHKQVDVGRFWWIEPTLTTAAIALITQYFGKSLELTGMMSLVAGLVAFVAFGQDRMKHMQLIVHSSNKKPDKGSKQAVPLFRELVDGREMNVDIRFFPPSRIIKNLLGTLLFNLMPLLIVLLLVGGSPSAKTDLSYIGLWWVISIPFTFIYWLAYLRRDVYDNPVLREIMPDGRLRPIKIKREKGSRPEYQTSSRSAALFALIDHIRTEGFKDLGIFWILIILPVLMFVMSIVLMLGA